MKGEERKIVRRQRNILTDSKGVITNQYTLWLYNMIARAIEYTILLDVLHSIKFYSLVRNDDNRGKDGLYLRQIFTDSVGGNPSFYRDLGDCTMLEMLLALSNRLVFETVDGEWEKDQSEWFFILLDNLCLEQFDDFHVRPGIDVERMRSKIDKLLARTYGSHGNGGLFPLKNIKQDQRDVEIWYQMSAYIMENYF